MSEPGVTLHSHLLACRRCVDAGYAVAAPPIVSGPASARLMVVGQAPGKVEASQTGRPFSGLAGKRLFRWLAEAGWDEDAFRSANYMTAITKCYPGPHPSGRGDRVPSRAEQALCQPWLEQELALVHPLVVVPVGGLAIGRFLKPARLEDVIGRMFARPADDAEVTAWAHHHLPPDVRLVPLPHPSGASQWINQADNQARLQAAVALLRSIRNELLTCQATPPSGLPNLFGIRPQNESNTKDQKMEILVKQGTLQQEQTELLVVNLFDDVAEPGGALKAVDEALGGLVTQIIAAGDFKGKLGKTHLLYTNGALPAKRVLIAGLGKESEFKLSRARQAAAAAAKRVRELGVERFSTIVHGAGRGGLSVADAAQALVEGSLLGAYRFSSYRREAGEQDKPEIAAMTIIEADPAKLDAVRQGARAGQAVGEQANWARDLVNEPANYLTPRELARRIRERGEAAGLKVEVLGEKEMAELGAGSFLGIAQGSTEEGQFIILEHIPQGVDLAALPTVVLVGKAITFDTGGISIKPHEGMWRMKDDMGGGAATAAALIAAATLNLPMHAVGLIPSTENMPAGNAIKPSDVVKAMNGKTVEIISTDAEGRQVLADALCYAARYNPTAVVDIATLTGSMVVALGPEIAGVFCDDEELRGRLLAASELTGEPLWPMPIWKPYRRLIDTDVADMKNSGGRYGGSIIAALFLREFAEGYPWAHLDIAGPVFQEDGNAFLARGANGFGARLLFQLLQSYCAD